MFTNFRQGLISFQQSGSQSLFLLPSAVSGYVDLSVSPTAFIATIAHGSSDYLINIDTTIQNAFGPLTSGSDNHLFLEINLLTGAVVPGTTILEPITSLIEPIAQAGQMWFDLNVNVMKVRNPDNTKWLVTPRVTVGVVLNGNTNQIVHANVGTGVGLNVPGKPGYLMLDNQLRPLRTSIGELLTTDSEIRVKTTAGTSGVLAQPLNGFVHVRAGEPIPTMSLVYFTAADTVSVASSNPALTSPKTPIGLVQQALATNEIGVLTQGGEVSYEQWAWGPADFGKPVYCGFNGEVTTTRPQGVQVFRVGYVKNAKSILLYVDSETQPQVVSSAGSIISGVAPVSAITGVNLNSEIVTSISMLPATSSQNGYMTSVQATALGSFDSRIIATELSVSQLTSTKADTVHTHSIANVTGLQSILDGKALIGHTHTEFALTNHVHTEFSLTNHTHIIDDVAGLQNALNLKSNNGHTHTIADSAGLQSALDDKAFAVHTHPISNINLLQLTLDGKASLVHTHTIANVTGLQGELDTLNAAMVPTRALYTLATSTSFTTDTNAWSSQATIFETGPNPVLSPTTLDAGDAHFTTLLTGTYKMVVTATATPAVDWLDANTVFGTRLVAANETATFITLSAKKNVHTRSIPANAGVGANQSTTWVDIYYFQANASETFTIAAFTAADVVSSDLLDFRLVVDVEYINPTPPVAVPA